MRITITTTSSHHSVNTWNDITYVHRTRIWHESFRPMTMDFELSYTKLLEQQHMENRWRRASAASASSNGMCLTAQVASAHTRSAKCWEGFTGMRCCAASASLGWDLMLASHGRMSVDAWVYHIHPYTICTCIQNVYIHFRPRYFTNLHGSVQASYTYIMHVHILHSRPCTAMGFYRTLNAARIPFSSQSRILSGLTGWHHTEVYVKTRSPGHTNEPSLPKSHRIEQWQRIASELSTCPSQ